MAEIDATISKLISELKKLQGAGGGADAGTRTDAGGTATERSEVEKIESKINDLYDERYDKESEAIKRAKKNRSDLKKALAEERKALQEKIKRGEELEEQDRQRLESLVRQVREADNLVQKTREAADAAKDLSDSFANIFGGPGAVKVEDIFSPKAIGGVISGLSKIGKTQQLSTLATQSATKASFMFLETVIKTSIALADTEAKFMKATGASKDFARSVTNSYERTREFGATMEETSAAYKTLFNTFTDFTMLSKAQRESIAETSTLMAKLGISNEDFAKSIQTSTKALGMSSEQAGKNMEDLAVFAQKLGVEPQKLAADFARAGDMLAKLGSQGTKAFKDLAIVAKTTGMQIEKIVNLTNKFDTFEGAADQAGKLNAALGGNFVNAMDLMMATNPAERFEIIRDSLLDTGLSFEEMGYYQKNFLRDSLGLSDVGELAALMSGDMDLVAGSTEKTGQELIDLKHRVHEMATMQENLNTMLANMIPIITPLIDIMKDFTEFLAESKDFAKGLGLAMGALTLILGAVFFVEKAINTLRTFGLLSQSKSIAATKAEAKALKALTKAQKNANKQKMKSGGISRSFTNSVRRLGRALSAGAKGFLALGAAAVGIGAGIYLAATGAAELALAFKDIGDNGLYAAAGIFAVMLPFGLLMGALIALVAGPQAAVSYAAVGLFLAIGVSAMALGAGIMFAAQGMAELVKSFAGIEVAEIYAISVAMLAFGASIVAFAGAAMMLGNPLALAGIAVLTGGIVGIAFALTLVEDLIVNVATAFASLFATIANPQTAENIKQISEAIQAIPARKNIEFATSMSALAAANTAAAALGAVNAVTATVTGVTPAAQTTKQEVYKMELPIMLDGKEIDRKIVELVGGAARDASAGRAR